MTHYQQQQCVTTESEDADGDEEETCILVDQVEAGYVARVSRLGDISRQTIGHILVQQTWFFSLSPE